MSRSKTSPPTETVFLKPDEVFPQASSIKIAVLAELYRQAQQDKLKLTDLYTVRHPIWFSTATS